MKQRAPYGFRLAFACMLTMLFNTASFAQGYINPPIYATGKVFVAAGGSVTTQITNAINPNNLNILANGAITSWSVVMPSPAFDGQLISIGCPGGSVGSLSVTAPSPDTVVYSGISSCTGLGQAVTYQYNSSQTSGLSFGVSVPIYITSAPSTASIVPTNTALSALASSIGSVIRGGVLTNGDSPMVHFIASGSACSLNAGAGDVGSQVPTSDGKCWLASPIVLDPRDFGGLGTGSDDTAAIQATSNAALAGQTVVVGANHLISAQIKAKAGVNYSDGSIYWTTTSASSWGIYRC